MRSSISAQSCDSVPPAPAWTDTIAGRSSYGSDRGGATASAPSRPRGCPGRAAGRRPARRRTYRPRPARRSRPGRWRAPPCARWRPLHAARRHVEAVPARRSGRSTDRDRRCASFSSASSDSLAGKSKAHRRVGHEARQAQGLVLNSVQPRSPWGARPEIGLLAAALGRTLAGLTQGSRSAAGRRRSCHRSPGCRHSCSACSHARTE